MGESVDDRVSIEFSQKELNPNVVSLSFIILVGGIPLENEPKLKPMEILKIIGVMCLILPKQDLSGAGSRGKILRNFLSFILYFGGTICLIGCYVSTNG